MRILVTGAAGFIGSHFVRLVLETHPEAKVVVLDALKYSGNLSTLRDVWYHPNFRFYPGRIEDATVVSGIIQAEGITHVVNFAAESHNDRSLLDPTAFLVSNAMGVQVLLTAVRDHGIERMVQVSTDEVYGSILSGSFTEASPIEPNTPYSASKAAGDLQCRAFYTTFGVPVMVTRGGNTYGPYQFPEKLIPFFVSRLVDGKKVPMYGDGGQVREFIHAQDHAAGILRVLLSGEPGEIYNVGDINERRNRETIDILLQETGRDESLVKSIPDPRGGAHDQRYSLATDKLRGLGWKPERPFEEGLRETVRWYIQNEWWWRPLIETPDFVRFTQRYYGPGLGEDL
ncbi:MAG: dTDP-glucose 4,6-dehydratase [Fimbriimonas sp.]